MAQLDGMFDATSVQPAEAFSVIPAGKYKVMVVDSDMRPTKDGNGKYLWLELDVIDGEYQGRKLWDRLNIVNQNAQAVEIAQRALSALCHATGKLHVSDSADLHGIPVMATVRVRAAREQYDASNEIRGYEAAAASAPVSRFPTAAKPTTAPTASGNPMPWKRGAA
jgi:hypothetical protein